MRQPLVFTTVRSRREDREFQRYNKPEEPEDQPRPVEGRRQELLKKFQWHLFTSAMVPWYAHATQYKHNL